jgi:glucose-6-phosphate dehydrogenase assembly protein OpcA
MIIDQVSTTTCRIEDALIAVRHRMGGPATGTVLTLVIVTDEAGQYDALRAALEAARDHPSRILAVIPRESAAEPRLDAEIQAGETGPAETVLMRLYGALVRHAETVVLPLLVPDAPVLTWWPGRAPRRPAEEPLGSLAGRRVTDAAAGAHPLDTLDRLAEAYRPGDTDLSWTRITPWRSLLAAALDQSHAPVTATMIEAASDNPSAALLGAWLGGRLGVPCELAFTGGPGITAVRLATTAGPITVTRPDGRTATLARPGQHDRNVALHRRTTAELIAEEMRRLQPDDVYREALCGWSRTVVLRTTVSVAHDS